jgi:hypothetical protein
VYAGRRPLTEDRARTSPKTECEVEMELRSIVRVAWHRFLSRSILQMKPFKSVEVIHGHTNIGSQPIVFLGGQALPTHMRRTSE